MKTAQLKVKTLKEYNNSLTTSTILTGKEYRRVRRKGIKNVKYPLV